MQDGVIQRDRRVARIRIVACAVFRTELAYVLGQLEGNLPGGLEIEVTYLEAGLHSRLVTLKKEVSSILDERKDEKVILLYGARCHPDFEELAQNHDVVSFNEPNCVSLLSNSGGGSSISGRRTFYLTPGWIIHWKEIFAGDFGVDEISIRQNFEFYDRMLLLANASAKIQDEQLLEFFDVVGVHIEVDYTLLSGFSNLILKAIGRAVG